MKLIIRKIKDFCKKDTNKTECYYSTKQKDSIFCSLVNEKFPFKNRNNCEEILDTKINLPWKKFPKNKPLECGSCLVILEHQNDLGLSTYQWQAWWDEKQFIDFKGCNDIRKGASIKYFVENRLLVFPEK